MDKQTDVKIALLFQTRAQKVQLKKIDKENFLILSNIAPMSFIVDQPKRIVGTIDHEQFFSSWVDEFNSKPEKEALIPTYLTFKDQYVLMLNLFQPEKLANNTWQFKVERLANEFIGEHDEILLLVIRRHPIDYPEVQALFKQTHVL